MSNTSEVVLVSVSNMFFYTYAILSKLYINGIGNPQKDLLGPPFPKQKGYSPFVKSPSASPVEIKPIFETDVIRPLTRDTSTSKRPPNAVSAFPLSVISSSIRSPNAVSAFPMSVISSPITFSNALAPVSLSFISSSIRYPNAMSAAVLQLTSEPILLSTTLIVCNKLKLLFEVISVFIHYNKIFLIL